jgi:hypothetical protein
MEIRQICYLAFELLKVQVSIPTKLILFRWVLPFVIPFLFIVSFFIYELLQHFGYVYFYSAFLICLLLFSQAKFHASAYLDPIHLFPWSIDKIKKRIIIFLFDLFGFKLILFVGFGSVLVFMSSMPLVDVAVLFFFYAGFTSLDVAMLEQSLRRKVLRVMYKYLNFLLLSLCLFNIRLFVFLIPENTSRQVNLHARADIWYLGNWSMAMFVILIVLISSLFLFITKDNLFRQKKPFIVDFNDFNKFF